MCIIVAKPKGVKMPSWGILENCWDANDDGAGVAFSNGEAVHIRKGLMTFAEFKKYVMKLSMKNDLENMDFIAHFRITSVGETTPRMTHPFRVDTEDIKQRMSVSGSGKMYAFHNGTITSMKTYSKTYSDTFLFTETVLNPMFEIDQRFYEDKHFSKIITTLLDGDKLALIDKHGIKLYGNFNESNGVYYSNYGYEDWTQNYIKTANGTYYYIRNIKQYTRVSKEEYIKACRKVEYDMWSLYANPTESVIDKFSKENADEIDDITTWESMNTLDKDNLGYTADLEALGVV